MRRLILFRHGKAEIAGLTGGDLERPLAERGRVEAEATARWLQAAGFTPDVALVSPSLRTRSTWDCARDTFPAARLEVIDRLYLATAEVIMELIDASTGADTETVMVIGHNPGLQDLASRLAHRSGAPPAEVARLDEGFPTASACVFRMTHTADGVALAAIHEPPRTVGAPPRWAYLEDAQGDHG